MTSRLATFEMNIDHGYKYNHTICTNNLSHEKFQAYAWHHWSGTCKLCMDIGQCF